MRDEFKKAFNDAADHYYQENTRKNFEELNENGYLSYGRHSWADGLSGDEFTSINDARECGESAAAFAIEKEEAEAEEEE